MLLGEWQGRDISLSSDVVQQVGASDYLNRYYTAGDNIASLYIGYYRTQQQGAAIHSPMNCLPGAGWLPRTTERIRIDADAATSAQLVNKVVIVKGLDQQLVLYWYQTSDRITASEYLEQGVSRRGRVPNRTVGYRARPSHRPVRLSRARGRSQGAAAGAAGCPQGSTTGAFAAVPTMRFSMMVRKGLLALACGVALSACSSAAVSKQEHFNRAEQYVKDNNLDAAVIEYRNAIQQDPEFAEAYRKLAVVYLRRGDVRGALRSSITAADLAPEVVDAQIEAGNLLLLTGRFDDAKERATKALAKDEHSVRARVLLGNATVGLKDIDAAIKESRKRSGSIRTLPAAT